MSNKDNLDIAHLRSFLAVADTLHFTSAAYICSTSQSTISQHIHRLEAQLDCVLLKRSTKQVELTDDGQALIGMAQNILRQQERVLAHFHKEQLHATLRLGITEDLVLSRFPEDLRMFRQDYPQLQIDLTVGLSHHLHQLLADDRLDIVCGMRQSSDTHGQLLWEDELVWFSHASTCSLAPDESFPLVTFPDRSITRKLAIETLNRIGRPWHIAFSSTNLSAILAAVRAGYGITPQPAFLSAEGIVPVDASTLSPMPRVEFIASVQSSNSNGPANAFIKKMKTRLNKKQKMFSL
ncbi:LysR family transcriptional regulator [Komagataeibacter oboediens]|uniref:LysR family transcriptional regulator n=1 Tax=Komagataeibacter oboediens TaxID=65958 RepID=UPI000237DA52|nr:LysR family transcriptional regulator [Komagataeibacter oboediens]